MTSLQNQQKPVLSTTRIQRKNTGLILKAALEIFSIHGYSGATLEEISKKSGLSKPNILYYFKSKKEIHIQERKKRKVRTLQFCWIGKTVSKRK
jgi:hypothetical protein